jgi:pimeloyl-ACP methyl ester carboxylesterase
MMYPALLLALAILLLQGCELGTDLETKVTPNYHLLSPCEKPEAAVIFEVMRESLCGTISVFEDRSATTGRKIDLNVMLLPATTSTVQPDPIFFLAGGPGQSAVETGPYLFARLHKLRKDRDIVLVDQRGTGESNSLACEIDGSAMENLSLSIAEAAELQLANLEKCLSTYDADPALYTTPVAMDDLDEVRRELGYDKINLIGISYGTRAGLVYLRRHEESVRSLVLDAVVPLTMPIPKNVAVDAQSAFNQLLIDCESQPDCAETYPDLAEHFQALANKLPITVTINHPKTGVPFTAKIDPHLINRLVRAVMYDRTLSRLLPLAIEEAFNGNYTTLSTLAYTLTGDDSHMSTGMMASVLCAEDMKLVDAPNNTLGFDNALYESLAPVCEFWPTGSVPEEYFEAVVSDVPVLLTSGVLDPITPPKYGWEAAATLSNSEHIVVRGVGHGTLVTGCMPDVINDFLTGLDLTSINISCTSNISRPAFFTSYAGAVSREALQSEEKIDD